MILALARAAQERGEPLPPAVASLGLEVAKRLLSDMRSQTVSQGIELARELRLPQLRDDLAALAGSESKFAKLRPAAVEAILAYNPAGSLPLLTQIMGSSDEEMSLRTKVAEELATVNRDDVRAALVAHLRTAPHQLAVAIARGLSTNPEGGRALMAEVAAGRATAELLQNVGIVGRLREFAKIDDLDGAITKLTQGLPPADERCAS